MIHTLEAVLTTMTDFCLDIVGTTNMNTPQ